MTDTTLATTLPLAAARQRLPPEALRRRQFFTLGWTYLIIIGVATVMLGTFLVAFIASLKVDPLERPFRVAFDQVNPFAWVTAADLGRQGAGDPWWGGFAPGGRITFTATYTAPPGTEIVPPQAEVPRRRPGSGIAAALTKYYAIDYALLTLTAVADGEMNVTDPQTGAGEDRKSVV